MLMRLSEVMFVEVLRRHLRTGDDELGTGWLAALRDPIAGRALAALHAEVARPWTLEALAATVGSSRSRLSERFARTIGLPPMRYLARWRMHVAACRLRDTDDKLLAVALDVGYDSEAALSRAFKRLVGVSPREWREAQA